MFGVVTSPQLNQVNTPIGNKKISPGPRSFEVSRTPLADSPICGTQIIEMFGVVTSPQLNQVNIPIGNNKISLVPPSFEVSRTPVADSPICGKKIIEMS
jgi:hypothetical protein